MIHKYCKYFSCECLKWLLLSVNNENKRIDWSAVSLWKHSENWIIIVQRWTILDITKVFLQFPYIVESWFYIFII